MLYHVAKECKRVKCIVVTMMNPYAMPLRCLNQRGIVSCRDVVGGLSRVGGRAQQNVAWATLPVMLHAFILIPETARINLTSLRCAKKLPVVNGVRVNGAPVL